MLTKYIVFETAAPPRTWITNKLRLDEWWEQFSLQMLWPGQLIHHRWDYWLIGRYLLLAANALLLENGTIPSWVIIRSWPKRMQLRLSMIYVFWVTTSTLLPGVWFGLHPKTTNGSGDDADGAHSQTLYSYQGTVLNRKSIIKVKDTMTGGRYDSSRRKWVRGLHYGFVFCEWMNLANWGFVNWWILRIGGPVLLLHSAQFVVQLYLV